MVIIMVLIMVIIMVIMVIMVIMIIMVIRKAGSPPLICPRQAPPLPPSKERDLRSAYCLRQILYRVAIVVANQMCHQHRPADFFSPDKKVSANFTFLSFQQLCKMELISRYAKWLAHSRRPKIEPGVHVHFEICI